MKKIMFCGGGSAGHVIPNIALIEDLKGSFDVCYMGTDGIEKRICQSRGVTFYTCGAVKVVRGKFFCNLAVPFRLVKSVREAGNVLDEVKPDLLFCKGGYASVPPALAAARRHIPVITHESDVTAGLANRLIAGRCRKVLTSFACTTRSFDRAICTGTPMRSCLFNRSRAEALALFGLDMRPTLLVLGGGSGSRKINQAVRNIASTVCRDFNILHICGRGNAVGTDIYGYRQVEFADDMGLVYACADGAVSRCGSNTAHELIALKIPTLFIPLENRRSRGDQVKNAEYFSSLGLCRVLREGQLCERSLLEGVYALLGDGALKKALETSAVQCGNQKIIREICATLAARG